jgi:hypothetical protein
MMHTFGSAPRFSGDGRAGDMLSPASDAQRQLDPPATSLVAAHGDAAALTHSSVPEQLQ